MSYLDPEGDEPSRMVDDDGKVLDPRDRWAFQTELMQDRTLQEIEVWREHIEDEDGKIIKTERLASGRVLLVFDDHNLAAMMSDHSLEARLLLDPVTAELWEEWWPTEEEKASQ